MHIITMRSSDKKSKKSGRGIDLFVRLNPGTLEGRQSNKSFD